MIVKKSLADNLEDLATRPEYSKWSSPEFFDLSDNEDQIKLEKVVADGRVLVVHDGITDMASGLFELNHPDQISNNKAREEFIRDDKFKGHDYGRWVLFPWSSELVRYPEPDDYRRLKTSRYRDLITEDEQRTLNMARIAIFGMSVGGNIAQAVAQNGIGEAIALGDMDCPDISNMGRTGFKMTDLGVSKLDVIAKEISKIDPFIEQTHFRDGISKEDLAKLTDFKPTLIGDEVDDMRASALLRIFSAENKLPYVTVSDVDDRSVVEVCRHDLGGSPLFASKLVKDRVARSLADGLLSKERQQSVFINSIGFTRLTPELIQSGLDVGRRLAGIPQLGTTALASAGVAVATYRDILTGEDVRTGFYSVDVSGGRNRIQVIDWARALRTYVRNR